jgi:hypothetical protein
MALYSEGAINLNAQVVPDLFVTITPPRVQLISGVATDVAGIVGTASWGPIGIPQIVGGYSDYVRNFGPLLARPRDMGTLVAVANQQGATSFRCVRVTDGTDTAAQVVILVNCLTVTSKHSGSLGNKTSIAISPGSKTGTYRAVVSLADAGFIPEAFDNVEGSGNAFWVNLAETINNGQFGTRSGSEIVIATAGAGTTAPVTATYTLAGGTDGAASVTDAMLVGLDTTPRTGMYALRGSGASVAALAECTDTSTWPAQVAFGSSEGIYMMLQGPKGDTVSSAIASKASAGIDSYAAKVLFGDWVYWQDNQSGIPERLVSPQGVALGRYATLSPEQSALNKPVFAVIGTQRTKLARPFSRADLQALGQAGIDTITNPLPGGAYFGFRFGRNSSSNPVLRGDNYTRMTHFLALSMDQGMGRFVGRLHSESLRRQCKQTLDAFLEAMMPTSQDALDGMIEDFLVICDESNNPPNRRGMGWLAATVQVRYLSVVEFLHVALEGGQTVQITRQRISTAAGAV